jgi:RNA ligase (TIGR02306 family)
MGLLFKPENILLKEGDNIAEALGVLHYDPPQQGGHMAFIKKGSMGAEKAPFINPPTYDLDSLRRYVYVFEDGEEVWITEKIHGCNARYTWQDRGFLEFYKHGLRLGNTYVSVRGITRLPREARYLRVGSRNLWKRFDPSWDTIGKVTDVWWEAALRTPTVARYLEANPGYAIYGEVYGKVQDLQYGLPNRVALAVFDIRRPDGSYIAAPGMFSICGEWDIPTVPLVGVGDFDIARIEALAEGPSLVTGADHTREGIVVKPMRERYDNAVGRVALKLVGSSYYERGA